MTRKVQAAVIATIMSQHDFNEEVARRIFVGPRARHDAREWVEREIEYQKHHADFREPENADIHVFCHVISGTIAEIAQ